MKNDYDVIVLGLGAMGSATLYQLAQRGVRALGIDQFDPPHAHGSSHGDTRIMRQAIGEGAMYTPFVLRSNEIWRELETESGENLMSVVGGIILWTPDRASAVHGRSNFLGDTIDSANEYGIEHEVLETGAIRRRFPQFKLRGDEVAYYEPGAGYLRPEACVRAQLSLAASRGAEIRTHETVREYRPAGAAEGVVVTTDAGAYNAARLILCAGSWVTEFVPQPIKGLFKVYPQVLYWFDVSSSYAAYAPENYPIFIWALGPDVDGDIYGFPAIDGPSGGLKIATEQYKVEGSPAELKPHATAEQLDHMYRHLVEPHLAGVGPACLRSVGCLYTVTPDSHFVIDSLPDQPNVILASPCSGHGFKHSAAIGEALAELAVDGKTHLDISAFALERFGV